MKIALAQILAVDEDRDENLKRQVVAIATAKKQGADFILFPEMFDIGYTQPNGRLDEWRSLAISQEHEYMGELRAAFAANKMWGAVTYLEAGVQFPRNSMHIIDSAGQTVCDYSKVHLYEPFENDACCEPGGSFKVFDFPLPDDQPLKIGTMICADRDFPESARVLMKMGAELVISPNACPLNGVLSDMLRVRAIENAVAVATVNYPAPKWDGHSTVIDVQGNYLERLGEAEEIRTVELPVKLLREYRRSTEWGDSFRKTHAYGPIVDTEVRAPFLGRRNKIGMCRK